MVDYAEEPIQLVEVMNVLDRWPAMQTGDVAWVYVALMGKTFSEAAVVVLTNTEKGVRIRHIDWGRP